MTLVTAARYENAIQAHLARGRLESEGVYASVAHEHHVWANWLYSNALGGVKVRVRAQDAPRASVILARMARGDFALAEQDERLICPFCNGEQNRDSRGAWKCAFVAFMFFQLPLPYRRDVRRCLRCGHRWKAELGRPHAT